mmetsp:Transcript_10940/g.13167  ORF Transcript_10940/g.13167 Transcript_10940/m.13167 type:complete len:95 (+) Transcript_10940:310-594(+)
MGLIKLWILPVDDGMIRMLQTTIVYGIPWCQVVAMYMVIAVQILEKLPIKPVTHVQELPFFNKSSSVCCFVRCCKRERMEIVGSSLHFATNKEF